MNTWIGSTSSSKARRIQNLVLSTVEGPPNCILSIAEGSFLSVVEGPSLSSAEPWAPLVSRPQPNIV